MQSGKFELTGREKIILLQTARISIEVRLFGKKAEYPEPTPLLKENCGAFVTLHKEGGLRGCIGYVVAIKPLVETIKDVACASAFGDPRFQPVRKEEYPSLELEISVLSPLRVITDVNEITVGEHGIVIRRGHSSGLLLPQVATEYGWDRNTFLTQTCHKAGLPGNAWKDPATEIEIFSAIVFNEKEINKNGKGME
jgi:AmmeMemoRadiSam system protein A